jgi:hypothetical protein
VGCELSDELGSAPGALGVKLDGEEWESENVAARTEGSDDSAQLLIHAQHPDNDTRLTVVLPSDIEAETTLMLGRNSDASISYFQGGTTYSTAYRPDSSGELEITAWTADHISGEFKGQLQAFGEESETLEMKSGQFTEVPFE